jgi:hypothetical protein
MLQRRRYFTKWIWVISGVLAPVVVNSPLSRLVAKELIDELVDVYRGYRLQVRSVMKDAVL